MPSRINSLRSCTALHPSLDILRCLFTSLLYKTTIGLSSGIGALYKRAQKHSTTNRTLRPCHEFIIYNFACHLLFCRENFRSCRPIFTHLIIISHCPISVFLTYLLGSFGVCHPREFRSGFGFPYLVGPWCLSWTAQRLLAASVPRFDAPV